MFCGIWVLTTKRTLLPALNIRHAPSEFQEVKAGESKVLECEAGGTPLPTIYWRKDGVKVFEGLYDYDSNVLPSSLGLGITRSRLFLDYVTSNNTAEYTCVADNENKRVERKSRVVVDTQAAKNDTICLAKKTLDSPARVHMWTKSRLEIMGSDVQLFCRVNEGPNETILNDLEKYEVFANGDLIIRKTYINYSLAYIFVIWHYLHYFFIKFYSLKKTMKCEDIP